MEIDSAERKDDRGGRKDKKESFHQPYQLKKVCRGNQRFKKTEMGKHS